RGCRRADQRGADPPDRCDDRVLLAVERRLTPADDAVRIGGAHHDPYRLRRDPQAPCGDVGDAAHEVAAAAVILRIRSCFAFAACAAAMACALSASRAAMAAMIWRWSEITPGKRVAS